MSQPILSLQGLTKRFEKRLDFAEKIAARLGSSIHAWQVHAVDGVDLDIAQGEVVGLVGESGSGKSTIGRMIAGLLQPSEGRILYRDRDITELRRAASRKAALKIQMIFQDPMSSLNPRMRVKDIIGEAPAVHGIVPRSKLRPYVDEMMQRVGLDPSVRDRYPHQFSGGQRQRIGIARALAVQPDFLICDESVAALDVSIQAQVLNLFMRLRKEFGLTYLFISHDLGVVEHLSDRVVILYLGRVVEVAPTEALFSGANHPYTQALLDEVPRISPEKRQFHPIRGEIPSPMNPPPGCHFHTRCPKVFDRCRVERPALRPIAPGRLSACHLNDVQTAIGSRPRITTNPRGSTYSRRG